MQGAIKFGAVPPPTSPPIALPSHLLLCEFGHYESNRVGVDRNFMNAGPTPWDGGVSDP